MLEIYQILAEQLGSDLQPLFRADLPGEAHETLADLTAARSLDFAAQISLKEGLAESIRYFRHNVMSRERT